MDYNLKLNLICAIKNSVTLICFTVLSVIFGKWWIIFFSVLFFSQIETKKIK